MAAEDIDADVILVGEIFYSTAIAGTALPVLVRACAGGPGYASETRAVPHSHATGCTLWPTTGLYPPPRVQMPNSDGHTSWS